MTQAGSVLQKLMDQHGIKNPTQLSKAMGNAKYQVATKRILDGTTKEPKKTTLKPFADFFKVSVDVFFTSDNTSLATMESNIMPTPSGGLIPLISFVQAGDWAECIDNFSPGDAEDWLPCPSKHSPSTFAVHVKGDSMTAQFGRSYPEGCIIFVDPEQAARAGDRVIAKLTDVNEATFKVLIEDNGMTFLKPLNPQYHTMQINGNCKVVGKVIGSYFPE